MSATRSYAAGQEALGAYAIIIQLIGYLSLVDVGIFMALGRFFSQESNGLARFHFTRARRLYALAGFDLGCIKLRLNLRAKAQCEFQIRQAVQSREPIIELDIYP